MTWFRRRSLVAILCLPLAGLYAIIVFCRRYCYEKHWFNCTKLPVPVIVVGNITVGGTGKTPTVIALCRWLQQMGYCPGIVSRGYKGKAEKYPLSITQSTDPRQCGDEPLLIHKKTQVPVVVDPNRVCAAQHLLKYEHCDIIVSDDGLQHYAMGRDIEIVLTPGHDNFGNGWFLPAGPLRESVSRLEQVDYVMTKGQPDVGQYPLTIQAKSFYQLQSNMSVELFDWQRREVHAVAGIAHPKEFFDLLRSHHLKVIEHPFPDHHHYEPKDVDFADKLPIIMTEKDAVKCQAFANEKMYVLSIDVELPPVMLDDLKSRIIGMKHE